MVLEAQLISELISRGKVTGNDTRWVQGGTKNVDVEYVIVFTNVVLFTLANGYNFSDLLLLMGYSPVIQPQIRYSKIRPLIPFSFNTDRLPKLTPKSIFTLSKIFGIPIDEFFVDRISDYDFNIMIEMKYPHGQNYEGKSDLETFIL